MGIEPYALRDSLRDTGPSQHGQARQLDRQREETHPPHVLEALESLAPPKSESLRLPKATPDPVKEYPVQHLAIRYRDKEMEP
jgi:hypothetical protein